MNIIIKIIGLIFCLISILYLVKPAFMRKVLRFFSKGSTIYIGGIVRLILAILFFLGAMESNIPWLIITFGVLFLIGSLLIFVLGPKLKPVLDWYINLTDLPLRLLSLLIFLVGALIIYGA